MARNPYGPKVCRTCLLSPPLSTFSNGGVVCDGCKRAKLRARIKQQPFRNEKHLAFVRKLPCCVNRVACGQLVHAHHVRSAATAGTGMKPTDFRTVPLCSIHHNELHQLGHETFQLKYALDLADIAFQIANASPYP